MPKRWTPVIVAAGMLFAVEASAAEPPRTMDLEILSNGQLLMRGEIIDGVDELEARLRVMREQEPPFELSIKLPKTFDFASFASVMKMIQDMGQRLGLIGGTGGPAPPTPLPDGTI